MHDSEQKTICAPLLLMRLSRFWKRRVPFYSSVSSTSCFQPFCPTSRVLLQPRDSVHTSTRGRAPVQTVFQNPTTPNHSADRPAIKLAQDCHTSKILRVPSPPFACTMFHQFQDMLEAKLSMIGNWHLVSGRRLGSHKPSLVPPFVGLYQNVP